MKGRKLATCLVVIGLVILSTVLFRPFYRLKWDEPHFFYQYAKHFNQGYGLVFNRGERVLGYTSPLFQGILASGGIFTQDFYFLSYLIFVLSLAGLSIVTFLTWDHLDLRLSGVIVSAGLIVWPLPYNYIGLETVLLSLFVYSAFYLYLVERYVWTAVAISLGVLTRFDGAIPALIILGFYIRGHRKIPWKLLLIAAAILIPWFVFSISYYGVLLPQSFHAKKEEIALSQFLYGMLSAFKTGFFIEDTAIESHRLRIFSWFILCAVGVIFGLKKSRYFAFVFLYAVGNLLGYTIFARTEDPWHFFPFSLGMRILFFYGIHSVASFVAGLLKPRKLDRLAYVVVLLIIALPVIWDDLTVLKDKPNSPYTNYLFTGRHRAYTRVARWLNENAGPDATVYTGEPATMAFYSSCIFYDYYGIATRKGWKIPWREVGKKLRPDFVVLPDGYFDRGRQVPPGYRLVKVISCPPYVPVSISVRQDLILENVQRAISKFSVYQ